MGGIAHDASGPASPKPGDIAPQQAPDSPDRGKLRVFISYSRDDLGFADQLDVALDLYGFCLRVRMKKDVVEVPQARRRTRALPAVGS